MQEERTNVPKIRFKGYAEEWEERKLEDIATMNARIGWQNLRTSEFLKNGEYMLITGTDFKNGEIDYSNIHYVAKERYDQDKKIQIQNGSILITKDGTLGKVAYVQGLSAPATLNAGVFNVKVREGSKVNRKYLFHYLKAPFLLKFANEQSTGGTIKHLNQNVLVKFPIPLPNFDEQTKISDFLTTLDDTIALHQRGLDLLKQTKQSYLQKMFPKKGEDKPEIRFAGFTDAWEQRKLTELATTYIGLVTTMTKNYTEYGTLLIRNSDIKEGKFDLNNPIYLKEDFAEQNKTRRMRNGDVVTVHTGDIGTSAVITEDLEGTIGFATITTRPSKELDSNFLSWYFNSNIHKKYARRMSTGDGRSNYNMKDFNKNVIAIPKLEEQQKIGTFFKQLDDIITLHQRELDSLKEMKKSLLLQMFV
ncbi:restriction endonuclease subunit S [Enterococcus faecium]|uniref:restriction endonuclease subunit S n=1 Tax=Enterococcus lactis TaxID=357441 RepID=UPI001A066C04|nr:restriction endonuclease subunit S [Enterococcus faecium]EME8147411.1 restriction endonuclease subunit S [Enterococcus faecium]